MPARAGASHEAGSAQDAATPEILDLAAYGQLACAIRADHRVWCWRGKPMSGGGYGREVHRPVRIDRLPAASRVFVGPAGVCATARAGGLYCLGRAWLMGREEEAGDVSLFESDRDPSVEAARVLDRTPNMVAIAGAFACALELGAVWCWGWPEEQYPWWLGSKTTPDDPVAGAGEATLIRPRYVAGLPALASIHAGGDTACGIDGTRRLWCWGRNPDKSSDDEDTEWAVGPLALRTLPPQSEIFQDPYGRFFLAEGNAVRSLAPAREGEPRVELGQTVTSVRWAGVGLGESFYAVNQAGQVIYHDGASTRTLPMLQGVERLVGGGSDLPLACALTRESRVFCWHGDHVPENDAPYPANMYVLEARQYLGWIRFPPLPDASTGEPTAGPALVPRARLEANDGAIRALSVGREEACAVRKDGRAYCWLLGREDAPVLLAPDALVDVAVSGRDICGVTADGEVACWVQDEQGLTPIEPWPPLPLPLRGVARIATTGVGLCALHTSGRVTCIQRKHEMRDGAPTMISVPEPIPGITGAVSLEATPDGFCAVRRQGGLSCWHERYGLLSYETPAPVRGLIHRVDQAPNTITAVAEDGRLWQAALHDDALTPVSGPQLPWQQLVHDSGRECGLASDGVLHCWGRNDLGQLGRGTVSLGRGTVSIEEREPAPVAGLPPLRLFALDRYGSCGSDGAAIWCWGAAVSSRIRAATPTRVAIDVPVASFDFDSVSHNGVAVDANGDVWAWGRKNHALRFAYAYATPVRMPVDEPMKQVALGEALHCGLTRSQRVVCWYSGLLSTAPLAVPVRLPGKAAALAVGGSYACAIASGRVFCWNVDGVPVEISRLRHAKAITVTTALACALSRDARIACWHPHKPRAPRTPGDPAPRERVMPPVVQWLDGVAGVDDIEFSRQTLHIRRQDELARIALNHTLWCAGTSCSTVERIILCKSPSSSLDLPPCREVERATPPRPTLQLEDWQTRPAATYSSALDGCRRTGETTFSCALLGEVLFPAPVEKAVGSDKGAWCALDTNGHLYCVGTGDYGQLGSGIGGIRPTPVRVALP